MRIVWEKNSKVQKLFAEGKINENDIIKRTQTENFPAETCTVRMARVREKSPFITLHIRGKSKQRSYHWNPKAVYECAETCRVNFGGGYDKTMCSNGNLDEDYTWEDVHKVVTEVKKTLDI